MSVISTVEAEGIESPASGRLELARWIADPAHPLTARVYVNRVWQHLFGVGIVRSVDNFGTTGELPSHPNCSIIWRADSSRTAGRRRRSFAKSSSAGPIDWAVSATDEQLAADPENRLQSWHSRRRMSAEMLYDSILSLSGELDLTIGGNTVREGTDSEYGYQFDVGRRAVYLPVFRNRMPDLFTVFDFPDPNLSVGRRNVSTLSTQALFLMNSPFIRERARAAAERLVAETDNAGQRIELLYQRGLVGLRHPPNMIRLCDSWSADAVAAREELDSWTDVCQAVICSLDFRYVP